MTNPDTQSPVTVAAERADNPAPPAYTILFASLALLSGIGVTKWLDDAGRATFSGFLHRHATTVTAGHDGVVSECLVKTGEIVTRNRPAVVLRNTSLEDRLALARSELAALVADAQRARAVATVQSAVHIKSLDDEIFETKLRLANLFKEKLSQEIEHKAWQDFIDERQQLSEIAPGASVFQSAFFGDPATAPESRIRAVLNLEAAKNASEVLAAQVEMCEMRLEDLERSKSELTDMIREATGAAVADARLAQAKETLNRLEEQSQALTLRARSYGKAGVFRKAVGDHVVAGEPIVELMDPDRQSLVVHVPSRAISGFQTGAEVRVLFPGGEERHGRVTDVPPQTVSTTKPRNDSSEAVVAVRVEPSGKLWPDVPTGSAVEVSLRK